MAPRNIIDLDDEKASFMEVGGKGINLNKLINLGYNVPNGFLVSTFAYQEFVRINKLNPFIKKQLENLDFASISALEEISRSIRMKFEKCNLSDDLSNEISDKFNSLSGKSYAVRSSATAEDLPNLSFAGQHDSFLNIRDENQLIKSVISCFSSVWTARAIQYREKNKIDQLTVSNAVVVQEMIEGDYSGVTFTANPMTGNRNEVVIEAIHGLGEALVSGLVEPDTYIVSSNNEIIDRSIGNQQKIITSNQDGGIIVNEISKKDQTISDKLIKSLAKISAAIAETYNSPQDIEWAIKGDEIYILQSRAITNLYPLPEGDFDENGVYLSINGIQGVLTPFTTLGLDVFNRFLYGVGQAYHFGGEYKNQKSVVAIGSRLWVNAAGGVDNQLGRKMLPRAYDVADPETARILEQIMRNRPIKPGKPKLRTIQQLQRALIFFFSQVRKILRKPDAERNQTMNRAERFVTRLDQKRLKLKNIEEKLDFIEMAAPNIPKFIFLDIAHYIGGSFAAITALSKIGGTEEIGINFLELAKSLPNNVTTQMNLFLWEITSIINNDDESSSMFNSNTAEEIAQLYLNDKLPFVAKQELDNFLEKYGFRGYSEIDLGQPRWKDDPTPIISHIKAYLSIDNPSHYPDKVFDNGRKDAQNTYNKIFENTVNGKFGPLKATVLNFLMSRVRKLMGMREYPKFIWVKSIAVVRKVVEEIGHQLVEQDEIDHYQDIFFLNLDDLKAHLTNKLDLREIIVSNKREYEFEYTRINPPRVILGNGVVLNQAKRKIEVKEGNLLGSPVSPGVVKGKVRVMRSPHDGNLVYGEILVCPATDPSWTPLFQVASGLIMEVGGLMTHGSVVAREHGIAAIVGVNQATILLTDGQLIEMDGNTGLIQIIADKE